MKRTTPPPAKDILELLPELKALAKTTIRLHPRRAKIAGLDKSKFGGEILWPADEPWPACTETGHYNGGTMNEPYPAGTAVSLVPVLQLRADDVPEIEFFPGTDLLQLLWCPLDHAFPTSVAKPFVYWRKCSNVRNPLEPIPKSELASDSYLVKVCRVLPERVTEYPSQLTADQSRKLGAWDIEDALDDELDSPSTFYQWEVSTCPSTKIGGYPHFVQAEEIPECECGRAMEHLLTITDDEFDGGTQRRWCPVEDRERWAASLESDSYDKGVEKFQQPLGFDGFVGGAQYIFVCRACKDWPIKWVFQR